MDPARARRRLNTLLIFGFGYCGHAVADATPEFNDSPKVINGCSDLFVEVFGEAGKHARSAVGNVMLPNQISVEIEGIVAVRA